MATLLEPVPDTALRRRLERYFSSRYGAPVQVVATEVLGKDGGEKGFGYGAPLRVTLRGAPIDEVVIHTVGTNAFGHDTLADRAAAAMLAYETFNNLPHHVRALDAGAIAADGRWVSLGDTREFFLVTEYAEGEPYFRDLDRIAHTGTLTSSDRCRTDRLASYLATIHATRHHAPALYVRRVRELFGHHECIAGLLDSYDAFPLEGYTSAAALRDIERRCVDWRHRLKRYSHRLCRVHGDFHPWNVLWQPGDRFALLDRSRGEWGEAADDVSCMAINYLFFSLQVHGRLAGPLEELWGRFFEGYLEATGDEELLRVIPPFFVWRALVIASPIWYPSLEVGVRRALFRFIDRLLDAEEFAWRDVNTMVAERSPCQAVGPAPSPPGPPPGSRHPAPGSRLPAPGPPAARTSGGRGYPGRGERSS
jgi:aminoglycoside phosphotransferase (APT) family kinase protein